MNSRLVLGAVRYHRDTAVSLVHAEYPNSISKCSAKLVLDRDDSEKPWPPPAG